MSASRFLLSLRNESCTYVQRFIHLRVGYQREERARHFGINRGIDDLNRAAAISRGIGDNDE
jgi:hypothetical protein